MHKMKIYSFLFLLLFFQSPLVCGIERQGCGSWTSKSPMPTSRHGLSAVTVKENIYVIGGGPKPGLSFSNVNEVFTPQ